MGNHSRRLERIEAQAVVRFPWEIVCHKCAAEGRTSTPEERCEASRCNSRVSLAPDHAELVRQAFREACIYRGQGPDAEEAKILNQTKAEQQAWEGKKAAMLGAAR